MEQGVYRFEQEVSTIGVPLWRLTLRDGCPAPERVPIVIGDSKGRADALPASATLTSGVYRLHPPASHIHYFVIDPSGERSPISVGEVREWLERLSGDPAASGEAR